MRAHELKDSITVNEADLNSIEEIGVTSAKYTIHLAKSNDELDLLSGDTNWSSGSTFYAPEITSDNPAYVIEEVSTGNKWRWQFDTSNSRAQPYVNWLSNPIPVSDFANEHKIPVFTIIRHFGGLEKIVIMDPKNWIDFIKEVTPEMKMAIIKNDAMNIQYVKEPTFDMEKLAVDNTSGDVLRLNELSEEAQLYSISKYETEISRIQKPSEKVLRLAIDKNPRAIGTLFQPESWIQVLAVEKEPSVLRLIKRGQSPEAQIRAYDLDHRAHGWMKPPTPEALAHMDEKGFDISRYLTKGPGLKYLESLDDPSRRVIIDVLSNDGMALEYVMKNLELAREDLPKIITAAVKDNGMALRFVDAQTQVEIPGSLLQRIHTEALNQTPKSSRFVKHPSQTVKDHMRRLGRI